MVTGLSSKNDDSKKPIDEVPKTTPSGSIDSGLDLKKLGLFGVIVGDLLGYTGAGVVLGYLAKTHWNAPGWVLFITTLAGLVLAFYRVYQVSKKEL